MPEKLFPTTRLEAFSDGVLAVIITIMVLDLKIPRQDGLPGLLTIAPVLFIYLLSFSFTGIYWINHHHLISRVERADPRVLYANLSFLFSWKRSRASSPTRGWSSHHGEGRRRGKIYSVQ